jgi:uncharacterized protein (DUF1015 family)
MNNKGDVEVCSLSVEKLQDRVYMPINSSNELVRNSYVSFIVGITTLLLGLKTSHIEERRT